MHVSDHSVILKLPRLGFQGEDWVDVPEFPFDYDDGETTLTLRHWNDQFFLFSDQCPWDWRYFLGRQEWVRFRDYSGTGKDTYQGACYGEVYCNRVDICFQK